MAELDLRKNKAICRHPTDLRVSRHFAYQAPSLDQIADPKIIGSSPDVKAGVETGQPFLK